MEAPPASLQFDASFESGNLAEARLVSEMPCAPPAFPHPLGTRPSLAPPLCPGGPPRHPPLHPLRRLEYDLHIRPDTLNTRHRVWFYFAVRGATRGQKVVHMHMHMHMHMHTHMHTHIHMHIHMHMHMPAM